MLQAKNTRGAYIVPALLMKEEIEELRKETFYCPQCKERVILRAGPKVTPHFSHQRHSDCSTNFSGGESNYHQRAKLLLYRWLQNQQFHPQLEKYLPSIMQRPDLYVRIGNRRLAIEFQCSALPIDTLNNRHKGYQSIKIKPLWIFGYNGLHKQSQNIYRIPSYIKHTLHFAPPHHMRIIYFCPFQKQFLILTDPYFITETSILANPVRIKMNNYGIKSLYFNNNLSKQTLYATWLQIKRRFRLANHRVQGKEFQWRRWLYKQHLHVEQLPSLIHLPIKSQYKMKVPLWHWQSKIILKIIHPRKTFEVFTLQECTALLSSMIEKYYEPNLTSVIEEYLQILSQMSIIKRVNQITWKKLQPITFYRYIEDAIRGDIQLINHLLSS